MKIELELADIERIADKVANVLLPLLMEAIRNQGIQDELLTIDQASELLQRSKGTIYQLVDQARHGLSDFPYKKQGRVLRFPKKKLLSWDTGHR